MGMRGAHHYLLELARAGAPPEVIAAKTGIPLGAVLVILRSPLALAEVARGHLTETARGN